MGRKTFEEQDNIRIAFLKRLIKREKEFVFKMSIRLHGHNKKNFIDNLKNNKISLNALTNKIIKYYYENNKT